MDADEPLLDLDDPDTRAYLLRAARRDTRRPETHVCPSCGRRDVPADQDHCDTCRTERDRARKRDWWNVQGDYRALLARNLRPREAARRWLAHRLRKGAVEGATVREDAARAGIAPRTLRRAREQLQHRGELVVERASLARGAARWRLTTKDERT